MLDILIELCRMTPAHDSNVFEIFDEFDSING